MSLAESKNTVAVDLSFEEGLSAGLQAVAVFLVISFAPSIVPCVVTEQPEPEIQAGAEPSKSSWMSRDGGGGGGISGTLGKVSSRISMCWKNMRWVA